jgi:hypothetical protein
VAGSCILSGSVDDVAVEINHVGCWWVLLLW